MTQFYSRIDTEFNGDVYNIPFSYSKESEISVYLDDELFTGWYFLNESQIKFTELPSKTPEIVTIKRTTDITKKVIEYTNNTMLSKEALNLSQDQLLNAVQEIYDNNIQNNIDIRAEVDEKVERVSDAVEQLEALNDAVETAVNASAVAGEKAEIATQQADIATQQVTLATQQAQIATEKAVEATSAVEEFAGITNVPYTMFESRYFEIKLDNASWLRADTGAYWAKAAYQEQYEAVQVEQNAEIADGEVVTLPIGKKYVKKGLSVKLSTETFDDYDFVLNITDETFRLPLKSKLASGKAVVGNGNQIYLSQTAGTKQDTPIYIAGSSGRENLVVDEIQNVNQYAALTSDPTKSGIETSPQGLYLYYYIGTTVQDANLINAGAFQEQLATKVDKFDAYKHSIPDYTNTIQVGSVNNAIAFTSYTAPVSGLLNLGWGSMINATNTIKILVNGHGVAWGYKTGTASFTTSFPVNAGDVVTWQLATGTSGDSYVYGFLCPYKEEGGN